MTRRRAHAILGPALMLGGCVTTAVAGAALTDLEDQRHESVARETTLGLATGLVTVEES